MINKMNTEYHILSKLLPIIIFPIFLFGCSLKSPGFRNDDLLNWKYADLRILDPSDAREPNEDIIAIYTRFIGQSFQIRIDFLNMDQQAGRDIYIALDTNPGGKSSFETDNRSYIHSEIDWDYLIKISDAMNFSILNAHSVVLDGVKTFIVIDQPQDRMIISLPKKYLPIYPGNTSVQVFTASADTHQIADAINPVAVDAPPPPRSKVLLAFWNTFSAASPAETLRSWAGAHSGPMSSRHGLSYLLIAADRTGSTIFVLDGITPEMLSALDYIKQLPHINSLINRGVLAFTDLNGIKNDNNKRIYDWLNERKGGVIDFYLLLNSLFIQDNSNLFFGVNGYAKFAKESNACDFNDLNNHNYLINSIPVECKDLLLSYTSTHSKGPLIIGGDFSLSLLGNPSFSRDFFTYLHEHPWIQILSGSDIVNTEATIIKPISINTGVTVTHLPIQQTYQSTAQDKLAHSLVMAPRNIVTALAIQTYSLINRPDNMDIMQLSPAYIGQVGEMIAAAEWVNAPSIIETCDIDLDYDGINECILSNENIFMVVEPEGGYIPFVFSRDDLGIHQIIGPTWEFLLGISDPSEWDPGFGVRADAGQILGAFQDSFVNWKTYQTIVKPGEVDLYNEMGSISKNIKLFTNHISVTIQNLEKSQFNSYIPLVVDPWRRYSAGWGDLYAQGLITHNYSWGISNGVKVTIQSNNPLVASTFKDSEEIMLQPEDPNYNFSPGHYLPYPMSLVKIDTYANASIDIFLNH